MNRRTTISQGLRRVADAIDALGEDGLEVEDVSVGERTDDRLAVDLRLSVHVGDQDGAESRELAAGAGDAAGSGDAAGDDGVSPADARTDGAGVESAASNGGSVRTASSGDAAPSGTGEYDGGPDRDGPSADADADDEVACPVEDCGAAFETTHGMKVHRTKVHRSSSGDDCPAYRDSERLAAAYERCDSFTEMREALGTDVSAQTVRRQTIAHGIHDPTASEHSDVGDAPDGTAGDAGDTTDEGGADDGDATDAAAGDDALETERELPEGMTVDELAAAVDEGKTLYDVGRRLGIERDRAMEVLRGYGLLGLVHGRVAECDDREALDADAVAAAVLERVEDAGESEQ